MNNVYNVSYPARKAHEPYYIVMCDFSGCTIIFHVVSYITVFAEKSDWTQNVFWFTLSVFF